MRAAFDLDTRLENIPPYLTEAPNPACPEEKVSKGFC